MFAGQLTVDAGDSIPIGIDVADALNALIRIMAGGAAEVVPATENLVEGFLYCNPTEGTIYGRHDVTPNQLRCA